MKATCPVCGKGKLRRGETREEMFGIDLGTYPADVCKECGESFIDTVAMKRVEAKAKELGLWGLTKKMRNG